MAWRIKYTDEDSNEESLFWSNEFGWTDSDFDTFTDGERETLNLPLGGAWESIEQGKA